MEIINILCALFDSAPILSTCVYEGLVNKSTTDKGSSDVASEETKCRVSLLLSTLYWKKKFIPEKLIPVIIICLLHKHEV